MPTRSVDTQDLCATEVTAGYWWLRENSEGLKQHGAKNSPEEAKQPASNYFITICIQTMLPISFS
jgi:hypothetical protein